MVVQAPGNGVHPRMWRSTANAGRVQSICASSTVSFGAYDTQLGVLLSLLEHAVLDAVQGGHEQPGAVLGQPVQQDACGVVLADASR